MTRMLTRRSKTNVTSRLRSTSRASGRVLGGSICSHVDSAITAPDTPSDRADLHALPQRGQRVLGWYKLMSDVPGEPAIRDGAGHGVVLELLRIVDLMAARHAARVEMADVLGVLPDRADHVAFHDLHVVEVVE